MRILPRLVSGVLVGLSFALPAMANEEGGIPNPTTAWNETWNEVLIDLWAIGILFGVAAIYLLLKYRAKSPGAVGTAKKLTLGQTLAWTLVPVALFLADDFLLAAKGWSLWNIQRTVPANAMEIKVTAAQWSFTYEYPDGVEITSTDRDEEADLFSKEIMDGDMVVPVGQPVVLRMTADDVIHSFGLTDFRLKEDIMPGRITYLWFIPTEPIVSQVVCVEFCGTNHSQMFNRVVAVPREKYDAWLAVKKAQAMLDSSKLAARSVVQTNATR
jgi:cytochrome c oxidase subunit II